MAGAGAVLRVGMGGFALKSPIWPISHHSKFRFMDRLSDLPSDTVIKSLSQRLKINPDNWKKKKSPSTVKVNCLTQFIFK